MKPEKRKCSSENYANRDRLSEMPDEVIVHILSYLPTEDAVRTMLIRPFGNLWTLLPTLTFVVEQVLDTLVSGGRTSWTTTEVRRFCIFVRNVLMLHKGPVIDKFFLLLGCHYDGVRRETGDDVRTWLKFALDKQAKEIYFCDVTYDCTKNSDLPHFISQSLVTLELCNCTIYPQLQVNLGSLKKLILYNMHICEEALRQFICGCPSLEELHILEPYSIKNLRFSAPNIRKLSLVLVDDENSNDRWLLDFPNLKSLDLEIDRIPDVINVLSVRDVHLKELFFHMDDENKLEMFKMFLEKFSFSEVFQLSHNASELFLHSIGVLHPLRIKWKRVVLGLQVFCQSCILGVYQLMRSLKHLEELIIYTTTELIEKSVCNTPNLFFGQGFHVWSDLPPVEFSDPYEMSKLKTITLHGYAKPWEYQLQLIEFLLKSATALEKLVIVPNQCGIRAVDKLEFVMHVSSFQRASPSARVLFL